MTILSLTLEWLSRPEQWSGPTSIPFRTVIYLYHCALTVVIASLIAIPLGIFIGHTGIGKNFVLIVSSLLRSMPTLGLLTVLSLILGIGLSAPLIALTALAIAPILTGTYAGVSSVDNELIEACRSVGFSEKQIISFIRLPLALPLIVSGLKSASVQVLATWTVAAFLPVEGLGRYLIDGLATRQYAPMLVASLIIIGLEFITNAFFSFIERKVTPIGVQQLHEYRG